MTISATVLAGRYRLHEQIAVGGVGEVWRAADIALTRPVAVKLLRAEYAQHRETLARFRAEARHAGSLSHPGIARVYDYGEGQPSCPPYLVMELVDGPSLAQVLARGPLGVARSMHVVAQAAAGLAAAHAEGLVHRDIKPANLLISPAGHVKITDFGIAHAAGSAPLTRTGMLVGTPAYLAPERVAGASGTPAADLYALGVVAYECLAGVPPFTGEPMVVAAAHRDRALPGLPAGLPDGVVALVGDLTRKIPGERPRDAGEVAERAAELARSLAGGEAAGPADWPPGTETPGLAEWPLLAGPLGPADEGTGATREQPLPSPAPPRPCRIAPAPDAGTRGRAVTGRTLPARAMVAAMTAAVVAAGLAGWLLAVTFGAAAGQVGPAGTATAGRIGAGAAAPTDGAASPATGRRPAARVPAHRGGAAPPAHRGTAAGPAHGGTVPDPGHRRTGTRDGRHRRRGRSRASHDGRAWS